MDNVSQQGGFRPDAPAERPPPLPPLLRAWSHLGARVDINTRLRVSRALASRGIQSGRAYRGGDDFVFAIDRQDPFQAAMLLGLHDPVIEALIKRYARPGTTVIDAGAHLGYFTLRLARRVGARGAVHAFECDPRLVPRLRRHVELNELGCVSINAAGLDEHDQEQALLYLPSQLGWASTLEGAWGATETATVRMVALDSYVAQRKIAPENVSLLKLDVEGAELRALRGARQVLAATSAVVLVEFLPDRLRAQGDEPEELLSLMADLGYEPWAPVAISGGQVRLVPGCEPGIGEDILFMKGNPTAPAPG